MQVRIDRSSRSSDRTEGSPAAVAIERAQSRGIIFCGGPALGAGSGLSSARQIGVAHASLVDIQLVSIASMPAFYDMAYDRGGSTRAWLYVALIVGPLALLR
jgi:hypothetical protein